jgi:hypothetical protein
MWNLCYIHSDGKAYKASKDASYPGVFVSTMDLVANQPGLFLQSGCYKDESLTLTVGGVIYMGSSGALTQTEPTSLSDNIQVVGIALTANIVSFDPGFAFGNVTGGNIDASSIADGSVSNTEFQLLNGLVNPILTQLDDTPDNLSYSGETVNGMNSESVSGMVFGDVCYQSGTGTFKLANASSLTKMPAVVICVSPSIDHGATGIFMKRGYIRNDSWGTLTVGAFLGNIWVVVNGGTGFTWSQTAPSVSTNLVQDIGYAVGTKTWFFDPNRTLIEVA